MGFRRLSLGMPCAIAMMAIATSAMAVTGQSYLGNKKVSGMTNALGQISFSVIGAANAEPTASNTTSPGTNAGVPCAQVYGDGVPLTPALIVAAYDVNGVGGANSADASLVTAEGLKINLGATPHARDGYNNSNTVTAVDVSIATSMGLQASLGTGSQETGAYCP